MTPAPAVAPPAAATATLARPRRRSGLAARIALLCVAIVALTALVGGGLALGLIDRSGTSAARSTLAQLATAAQEAVDTGPAPAVQRRLRRELAVLRIQVTTVSPSGTQSVATPLLTATISAADVAAVLAGRSVSATRRVAGHEVFLEGRPTNSGAVILVQRSVDAAAVGGQAGRRLVLALVVAAALASVLGSLVAWRLARPLRRTAAAAHALAAGRRDVVVPPTGPAEVAEVAEAVNSLAASLARSEARQRDFLLSVSHELRTPLTAITGYAESLADGVVPPEQSPAVGQVLVGEARRLERLVADLLDLARLEAQDFRIERVDVDLIALVDAAGRVWFDRCAAVGVGFGTVVPPAPLIVRTDPTRLRQVLDGLLENALRVTPAGRPIVLALAAEPGAAESGAAESGAAVLDVRDGGPGLSDDDLGVAFQPAELYRRYRGVRQVGTGVGLAIVHRLVARLGGTVVAGHADEGGARFTVRLPR